MALKKSNNSTLTRQSSLLVFLYACRPLKRKEKWKTCVKSHFRETNINLEFKFGFDFGFFLLLLLLGWVFFLRRMFSARKSSMENVWPAVLLSLDLETHAIHGNPHLTWSFKEMTGFCAHTSFNMSNCFSICFCLLSIHSTPRKNTRKFPLLPLQHVITVQGSAKSMSVDFFAVLWTWLLLSSSGNFNLKINVHLAGNNRYDLDISQHRAVIRAQSFALLLASSLPWFWSEPAGPDPDNPQP